jgi:hypothetical protein
MIRRLFIPLCMLLLAGCQTARELSGLGPEAKTRVGQLLYAYGGHSIVGDIVLRSLNGGDYDLYFSKGGVPVLEFQTRGTHMAATGVLAKNGWSGEIAEARGPLRPWATLREVLPYFDSNLPSAQRPHRWSATFVRRAGTLLRADVEFPGRKSMIFSFAQ